MNEVLKDKLERLPTDSGVYIMKDRAGKVIYVGKAVVLKNRVRQYFFNTQKIEKVAAMVAEIEDLEYIITISEYDALTLEATLVKKHWPKYNILLKDDRTAPYIKVNLKEQYPRFEITRRLRQDGAKYFGPYFFGIRADDILSVLKIAYGVRTCNKSMQKPFRECLDYHIKLCLGPCNRHCTEEQYLEAVHDATSFLAGKEHGAKVLLTQMMNTASENEDFERAIIYRDKLNMLDNLARKNIADIGRVINLDVVAMVTDGAYSVASVLIVRYGKLMGIKSYNFVNASLSSVEARCGFLTQFYENNLDVPDEIVLDCEVGQEIVDFIYNKTKKTTALVTPKRGSKLDLLMMAKKNADDYLVKSRTKEQVKDSMTKQAVLQLQEILGVKSARRMECYDISNISGTDKVASQVVFIDGEPAKKEYRKYKIKTVEGSNDFACMAEVLFRRLNRAKLGDNKFDSLPDLIVIDGGKGQLSSAIEALDNQGFRHIDIVSLAKQDEEIFVRDNPISIKIPHSHNALKLMQRIRDEAHRFAITYHRQLRAKGFLQNDKKLPKRKTN